jgi:hypothetical protein
MTAHLDKPSMRMVDQSAYPFEWHVLYRPLTGQPESEISTCYVYLENIDDYECIQNGYRVENIEESKVFTWEVVCSYKYLPQSLSDGVKSYTGIIVCGCKLINFTPV